MRDIAFKPLTEKEFRCQYEDEFETLKECNDFLRGIHDENVQKAMEKITEYTGYLLAVVDHDIDAIEDIRVKASKDEKFIDQSPLIARLVNEAKGWHFGIIRVVSRTAERTRNATLQRLRLESLEAAEAERKAEKQAMRHLSQYGLF